MEIIILAIIALALWVNYLIAKEFYFVADEKGYYEEKYLWICFFLGIVGYLLVIALPNNADKCQEQFASAPNEETTEPPSTKIFAMGNGMWKCSNCQTMNSTNYAQCKKCGRFRGR